MSVELRTALESLVTAVNRYSTPHDIVDGCMRGRIDGDAWSQSWNAIRSAKAEAERVLEAHVSPQAHSEKGSAQ